jgi:hypothetical protein
LKVVPAGSEVPVARFDGVPSMANAAIIFASEFFDGTFCDPYSLSVS